MKRFIYLFLFMLSSALTFSQTAFEIIQNSPDHNILEDAIVNAGLQDALDGPGTFTVFAPTDAAFNEIDAATLTALAADPTGDLQRILLYHVLGIEVLSTQLVDGQTATTLLGQDINVTLNMMGAFINDAQVTNPDLAASNGVVHVVDGVLLPPASNVVEVIVGSPVHTTLASAVIAAGLDDDLAGDGPFTVFAPTDAAFESLPPGTVDALLQDPTGDLANILLYHVVNGEVLSSTLTDGQTAATLLANQDIEVTINSDGVFINDAQVTVTDIRTFNGVVHVIDAVLLPKAESVVSVIVDSPIHNTLEAAVIAAELDDDLSGEGPFTVFAPTDDAFAALGQATIDALLADPTGDLAQILTYHVVAGEAFAADLSDGQMIQTLFGSDVMVTINADGVFINDAQVTVADVPTLNGVVHIIDAVLVPTATVVDVIVDSDVHNTLETAVIAAELDDDLAGAGPFTVFAPTDDAFAQIPSFVLDALLADPTGDLAQILTYHVAAGETFAADLSDGQQIPTLFGTDATITIDTDGNVFIDDAQITVTDIRTLNGVVHVIDAVIQPARSVVEVIVNSDVHNTLETAVIEAGLVGTLSGEGPFTVFAPTDDAFAALGQATIDALLADPTGDLAKILTYHVVAGEALAADLSDGQMISTIFGNDVEVTINADGVFINGSQVTVTDIRTLNGVVHVIDAVLLPPETVMDVITNSDIHTILETAVTEAGLVPSLSGGVVDFTVFAPTDDAFEALGQATIDALLADPTGDLAKILTYHVAVGEILSTDLANDLLIDMAFGAPSLITIDADGRVFINGAEIIVTDIRTLSGVVHVIDAVIAPAPTVMTVIAGNPNIFSTLNAALEAAELDDDLAGDGEFTVFAPTNAAFAALGQETIDALLADPTGDLAKILTYHVVAGETFSFDLVDGQAIPTLFGADADITINADGDIFIDGAEIILADFRTLNGIVHVIDAVILPTATVVDVVVESDIHTTLETAVIAAELDGVLSGDGPFTVFAPIDAAFDELDDALLTALLADPTGDLAKILQYHVVAGEVFSTDLSNGQVVETILGQEFTVTINADGIFVNDEEVIAADIRTLNGVVHVIDGVLLPDLNNVKDLERVAVEIFPNPASDFIQVNLPETFSGQNIQAQLIDMKGAVVRNWEMTDIRESVDVSEFNAGMYTLLLVTDNEYAVTKLTIK